MKPKLNIRKNLEEFTAVRRRIKEMHRMVVVVGIPAGDDDLYPDGEASLVDVAMFNEFGTESGSWSQEGIPERPFLRPTLKDNKEKYRKAIASGAARAIKGTTEWNTELGKIGLRVSTDIKLKMRDVREPANSDATIEKKGSSNPLIDTSLLRQSITWEVRDRSAGDKL